LIPSPGLARRHTLLYALNQSVNNLLVKYMLPDRLSSTLFALSDPTRRGILARLATGDATVTELAEPYDMSLAAVSKHLKVLETAGLISRGREAQWRPCHLEAAPLRDVFEWLESYQRFWNRSLDSLAEYLTVMKNQGRNDKAD
jgi:DNA-binding transcriptional ArsR family regulator